MHQYTLKEVNRVLIFFILVTAILHFARTILIPVSFSILFAMLLSPVGNWLESKGIGRIGSSLLSLVLLVAGIGLIVFLIGMQIGTVSKDLPKIEKRLSEQYKSIQEFIYRKFDYSPTEQDKVIESQSGSIKSSSKEYLKRMVKDFTAIMGSSVIVLVFVFLLLLRREKYETFFLRLYQGDDPEEALRIFGKITKVAQRYLTGRMISVLIMFVLLSIGFTIVGVKNAFLLAFIGAILTVIPYVGSIIGSLLPFLITLVTEDSNSTAMYVLVVIILVQALDNYYIEPSVIGGEVNLNALFTIFVIFVGGYIWGVAGMILFIPIFGILKIICDHVDGLKPYGYLIGDDGDQRPTTFLKNFFKRFKGKDKDPNHNRPD